MLFRSEQQPAAITKITIRKFAWVSYANSTSTKKRENFYPMCRFDYHREREKQTVAVLIKINIVYVEFVEWNLWQYKQWQWGGH